MTPGSHYLSWEHLVLSCAAEQPTGNDFFALFVLFPNTSHWYPWKLPEWSVCCAVLVQCGAHLMALVFELPRSTGEGSAPWCFPPGGSSTAEAVWEITLPKPVWLHCKSGSVNAFVTVPWSRWFKQLLFFPVQKARKTSLALEYVPPFLSRQLVFFHEYHCAFIHSWFNAIFFDCTLFFLLEKCWHFLWEGWELRPVVQSSGANVSENIPLIENIQQNKDSY